jgi:endoglucanase
MTDNLLTHLTCLTGFSGAPGFEDQVRNYLKKNMEDCGIKDIFIDGLGNLLCTIQGTDPAAGCIHFDAHMDEPAFMVKYIDPAGFIYITPLGYFSDMMTLGQRVVVSTPAGEVPGVFCVKSFHMKDGKSSNIIDMEDMWIDIGATSEQEVKKAGIRPGRAVTFFSPLTRLGNDLIMAKALDNRAACAVLLCALEELSQNPPVATIVFSFTVQEEFLLRGAHTVFPAIAHAFGFTPSVSICLDIAVAGDLPGTPYHRAPLTMGKGFGIKLRDKSSVSSFSHVVPHKLVDVMEAVAVKAGLPYQYDFLSGCTNAEIFALQELGIPCGGIGIPCRYIHSPVEMVHIGDLLNARKYVQALGNYKDF